MINIWSYIFVLSIWQEFTIDFRYLLELLDEELCQPAANLYPHNLAGILESAIRATNTQFEDPDILERLDVRLLDVQPGDTGWDVFSLDYKVKLVKSYQVLEDIVPCI